MRPVHGESKNLLRVVVRHHLVLTLVECSWFLREEPEYRVFPALKHFGYMSSSNAQYKSLTGTYFDLIVSTKAFSSPDMVLRANTPMSGA